jgi:hypothetical protein
MRVIGASLPDYVQPCAVRFLVPVLPASPPLQSSASNAKPEAVALKPATVRCALQADN